MGILEQVLGGSTKDKRLYPFYSVCIIQALGWSMYGIVSTFFAMAIGVTATSLGIAWALNELSQLISAPVLGRVTDACGRKPVLIVSFIWCAVVMVFTAFARNALEYIICRASSGVGQPMQSLLSAILTDMVPEKDRSSRFGSFMGISFGTFVAGCVIGTVMTTLGLALMYGVLVSSGVLFLSAVVGLFFMYETLPVENRRSFCGLGGRPGGDPVETDRTRTRSHWRNLLSIGLVLVWFSRFTSSFGIVCWMLTYPYILDDGFGWGAAEFGSIVVGCCLVIAPFQTWVFPLVDRRLGCHLTGAIGQGLFAPAVAILPLSVIMPTTGTETSRDYWVTIDQSERTSRLIFHFTTVFFLAVSYAIIEVSIPRLVAAYVAEPGLMGMAQGVTSSCRSVGFIVGSVCAGVFYDTFGLRELYVLAGFVSLLGSAAIGGAYCFGGVCEQTPESRGLTPPRTPPHVVTTPTRGTQTEKTPLMP